MRLIRILAPAAIAVALCGCSLLGGPRPQPEPDYDGPVATLTETGFQDSRTEVDMFVVTEIDGNPVQNSMDSTRQRNEGMGIGIIPDYVEHALPASRPVRVTIMGHSYHGAPILSMLNSEQEVSGTVTFTPAPNRIYEVKGTLGKNYSAVWIEENATGRVIGKKIELRSPVGKGLF